jgi:dipeptidyl aminopeptidase/acylaminoacyl peptidase
VRDSKVRRCESARVREVAGVVGFLILLCFSQGTAHSGSSQTASARQAVQAPDTEIYLAPLSTEYRRLSVGAPVNITNSPGYDNQPSFTPDGSAILFASIRGNRSGSTNATLPDIYRYNIASKTITRVTETAEGEYSPTVTPDGQHFSVIRVEADSTQRLWQFTLDGHSPELVLSDIKPVGYHVWADDHTLALFMLGQPATLQLADTRTGKAEIIARGIGRSLQRIPGGNTISFVERLAPATDTDKASPPALSIRELDPRTRRITPLVSAVAGATDADLAWTPDGTLLMAQGGALYGWRRGETTWTRMVDLEALGLRGVTRLAVSPEGNWIALVAQPQ